MSKKKHSKEKKKEGKVDLCHLSPETLDENASLYLEREQYKKAIENYKAILSRQGARNSVKDKLMKAYRGRIKELADKEMHKEAIELYEHVKKVYAEEPDPGLYLEELFLMADYPKAIHALFQYQDKYKDSKWFQRYESIIALFVLAERTDILSLIPSDSLLVQQKSLIEKALLAAYNKQDDKVGDLLQPIGLRSPYREWKVLIKGMIAFYQHQDHEAGDILQRIPQDSPIAGIIPLISFIISSEQEDKEGLRHDGKEGLGHKVSVSDLLPEELSLIKSIVGDQAEVLSLFQAFLQEKRSKNASKMIKILRKVADYFPSKTDQELLRQSSLNILMHSFPKEGKAEDLIKNFTSLWGIELNPFEEYRLEALMYERQKDWSEAIAAWENCLEEIKRGKAKNYFASGKEKNLAIAQILRRMAEHCLKESTSEDHFLEMFLGPSARDEEDYDEEDYIDNLIESLKYDPTDAKTYERIIDFYQKEGDKKKVSYWTEEFIKAFPGNVDALISAATMSLKRNALQKSLSFLDMALQHDPLNVKASNLKIRNHIFSAERRVEKRKIALARKDFESACSLTTDASQLAKVKLIWGVAEISVEEEEKGHALIREGLQLAKDHTVAYFHILLEGALKRIPENKIIPYYKIMEMRLQEDPGIEDVRDLIHLPFHTCDWNIQNFQVIRPKMKLIAPYLEKAIHRLQFTLDDFYSICHYLAVARLYPLLVHYAREGKKIYHDDLRLRFFSFIGQMRGMPRTDDPEISEQIPALLTSVMMGNDETMRRDFFDFMESRHPYYSRKPTEAESEDTVTSGIEKDMESKPGEKEMEAKPGGKTKDSTLKPRPKRLGIFGEIEEALIDLVRGIPK